MGEPQYIENVYDAVSQRVNHLLFINKMSQRDLAFRLGIKPPTVTNKMSGRNRWNLEEIIELAGAFGVTLDYMVGREPTDNATPLYAKAPGSEEPGANVMWAFVGTSQTPVNREER